MQRDIFQTVVLNMDTPVSWVKKAFEWIHHFYILSIVVTAIYGTIYTEENLLGPKFYYVVLIIYLIIITILLFLNTLAARLKIRYAEAMISLHDAAHTFRDCYRYLDCCINQDHGTNFEKRHFQTLLQKGLVSAKSAFEISSGVKCRTSLKLIGSNVEPPKDISDLYVQTLARDSVSALDKEDDDANEGTDHLITSNTDFHLLAEMKRNYFIHGDVESISDTFQNTSKTPCYRSVLVFPIRYKLSKNDFEDNGITKGNSSLTDQILLGFFTVDCRPKNSFLERYDSQMGAVIADLMFPVLSKYREVRAQSN